MNEIFYFYMISEAAMATEIKLLNKNKPTTFKILIYSCEIFSPFLTAVYNNSILRCTFPSTLKRADITPVYRNGPIKVIIDQLAYFRLFLNYLNELCMIKFRII